MEISESFVRTAAQRGTKSTTPASRFRLIETDAGGIAGTAGGRAENSTMAHARISQGAEEWALDERRIGRETLERLGVASGTTFFPKLGRKSEALFFSYQDGWKARSFPEKAFVSDKGFKLSFWNIDSVIAAAPPCVYLVEGELDALALVEAGIPHDAVLSMPNGAKDRPSEKPQEQAGYSFVDDALRDGLSRTQKFVWCGDADGPGVSLRSDMVRLLGPARFHFIEWPDGIKDANDMLSARGPEALRSIVEGGSLPWPVAGLYRMAQLPTPPSLALWDPGFPKWGDKVRLAPRTLSVVTGHPGHGKTALWAQIWFNVVKTYNVPIAVASFETRPKPHLRRQLRTLYAGRLEKNLSDREIALADAWINERYLFIVHPEQKPTLEWLLETAEVAVVRHGARIVQVDPWNRLEGQRDRNETETDYIGRCLRTIHTFAHDLNCHVQILAHPAKMDSARRGQAPSLEDTSGSKNWENMVDQGFVVHRPEIFDGATRKTEAVLYHRKARFEELGYPCKLRLDYSIANDSFVSADCGGVKS